MWQIAYDISIFFIDVAILYYVRAEYLSSISLDAKLTERLKRRKAIVKTALPAESPTPSLPF